MSTIFISHSSNNKKLATEIHQYLHAAGYHSIFLDSDRDDGIAPGENWENVLYRELRTCQVFIGLVTEEWLASKWCFAELTHAREKGKTLIGLQLSPQVNLSILGDTQLILFTPEVRDEGYERLRNTLKREVDFRGRHKWEERDKNGNRRSPYLGLSTFEEDDVAVFFGRDDSIRKLKEQLLAIRRNPGTDMRLLLVLGASGSGKSSLVRAGLVPYLKNEQERDSWIVLRPFRPGTHPLNELAKAFAQAFNDHGYAGTLSIRLPLLATNQVDASLLWADVRELFQQSVASNIGDQLQDLIENLRMLAGRPYATLLIIIDQMEELLRQDECRQISEFFALLRIMIATLGHGILVLGTLRSDFLGEFQNLGGARRIPYQPFHLDTVELDYREVIAEPARIAGIKLQDGLVDEIMKDTQTKDPLPLLAFALRELWERFGEDKKLTKEDYETGLGRLEGALDRKAEEVYAACQINSEQEGQMRKAFCKMVRMDEDRRFLRVPLPKKSLAGAIQGVLERFISARLLVANERDDEPYFELAHEALTRRWDRLRKWLEDDTDFLVWHRQLHWDVMKWHDNKRDDGALLRGNPLKYAEGWLTGRRDDLNLDEKEFIVASVALREDERAKRKRYALGFLGVLGVLAVIAYLQMRRADEQSGLVLARELATQAELAINDTGYDNRNSLIIGTLLALESLNSSWTGEGYKAAMKGLSLLPKPPLNMWKAHQGGVEAITFSHDGRWLATTSSKDKDAEIAIWDAATMGKIRYLQIRSPSNHTALAFSPDGRWLVAGCKEFACVWETETWQEVKQLRNGDMVWSLAFSPDSRLLATASYQSNKVQVYQTGTWYEMPAIDHSGEAHVLGLTGLAFSLDSKLLATSDSNAINIWDAITQKRLLNPAKSEGGGSRALAFSPDGNRLAAGHHIWRVSRTNGSFELEDDNNNKSCKSSSSNNDNMIAAFSPDGQYLATAPGNDTHLGALIWDVSSGCELVRMIQDVRSLAFSPDGDRLVTGDMAGSIQVWPVTFGADAVRLTHEARVSTLTFSPNERWLVTGTKDGRVRVFDAQTGSWNQVQQQIHGEEVARVVFSPDSRFLAVVSKNIVIVYETATWKEIPMQEPLTINERSGGSSFALFSPDSRWLITTTREKTVHWCKVGEWQVRREYQVELPVTEFGFASNGRWLAILGRFDSSYGNSIDTSHILNIATGELVAKATRNSDNADITVDGVVFKPGEEGLTDLLHELPEWKRITTSGSDSTSPDGRWNVSESGLSASALATDGDIESTKLEGGIHRRVFSPDSRWLATTASKNEETIKIWPLRLADLTNEACSRLPRNLTREEWQRYLGDVLYHKTCPNLPEPKNKTTPSQ